MCLSSVYAVGGAEKELLCRNVSSVRLEDGPRLEDVTTMDGGGSGSSVLQTGFLIMLSSPPL